MLKKNQIDSIAKLGAALTILIATSACTHQQLKEESQLSAIEETSTDGGLDAPTPDLMAPATPIPSDDNLGTTAPVKAKAHGKRAIKKASSKKSAHLAHKKHHAVAKRHKRVKTMVAAAGSVESTLPPAPPADLDQALVNEPAAPAPAVLDAPDLALVDQDGGHVWVVGLIIAALGALAVAGVKLRKTRASRSRLVFN